MKLELVKNYIYFYHIDKVCLLPCYPESITDSMSSNWSSTNLLQSSAPIQTWSNSGPRVVTFSFDLHREMLTDVNVMGQTILGRPILGNNSEDIMDDLINTAEAMALPKYTEVTRLVDPPIVSVVIGNQIYVKGVVTGGVTHTYKGVIRNGKYSSVSLSFSVTELSPKTAQQAMTLGKYRGGVE